MAGLILVIDEDPRLLETLGASLSAEDVTVVLATGADALREIRRGMTPDVVVIDLDMRGGGALLDQLERALEDLVPVVALSSTPRRLIEEAGVAESVVMKPFEVGQLRSRVHRAREQPRGAL